MHDIVGEVAQLEVTCIVRHLKKNLFRAEEPAGRTHAQDCGANSKVV